MSMDNWMQDDLRRRWEWEQEEARKKLLENADVIAAFIQSANSRGATIDKKSIGYSPILGVIAEAPGLAATLLSDFSRERDGLVSFDELVRKRGYAKQGAGYFGGKDFLPIAHSFFPTTDA